MPSQYETFKIYEDKKDDGTFKVYEDKLEKETSVALRESKECKEPKGKQVVDITSTKLVEREKLEPAHDAIPAILPSLRAALQEINQKKRDEPFLPQESPMSLEKSSISFTDSSKKEIAAKREASKALRLNFFDVDEYRADIYNYLRSAEVRRWFLPINFHCFLRSCSFLPMLLIFRALDLLRLNTGLSQDI